MHPRAAVGARTTDQEDPLSQSRSLALLALSLGLALTACKPTEPTTPAGTQPATPAPATTAATTAPAAPADAATQCPHADFNTFLAHFGNDIALQEKSVADPLLTESIDANAEPEPAKVTKQVPLAEVEWPVIPDPAALSRQGRELQVTPQADGSVQVLIRKPNTSDQQIYTFAQKPCWQLQSVDDQSI
jgi:hypothetical protein